jgi:hypothetical protein
MDTFGERLLLQAVGPVITTVLGTLIFGIFVAWIARKAQDRRSDNQLRDERIRSDNQLREERIRSENELRMQLIRQMTEAASSLYIATQDFWRKKNDDKVEKDELAKCRAELDQQYRASRVLGEVLERQLEAYFLPNTPKVLWHGTMDLLTIRYFHLIDRTTEPLLKANAGVEHTGLTTEQLKDQPLVLKTYRERLPESARAVLREPIRPLSA